MGCGCDIKDNTGEDVLSSSLLIFSVFNLEKDKFLKLIAEKGIDIRNFDIQKMIELFITKKDEQSPLKLNTFNVIKENFNFDSKKFTTEDVNKILQLFDK